MDKHTDTPWTADGIKIIKEGISSRLGDMLCVDKSISSQECEANAAYIVKCVNNYQELRDLLGRCHSWISDNSNQSIDEPLAREVYDAIARAEGNS